MQMLNKLWFVYVEDKQVLLIHYYGILAINTWPQLYGYNTHSEVYRIARMLGGEEVWWI